MRYALLATAAAALLSTGVMAQDNTSTQRSQAPRAYAPVAQPASPATTTFPQSVVNERRDATFSEQDQLLFKLGDRGLGNG